ncbi:Metallopeptidase family M24 [Popillia japonica]|uniref:Metallopeptidase family M24 n=1 Tax=Popillia japonica TaxID=7064 RepID=A0AAW1KH40_POPJA
MAVFQKNDLVNKHNFRLSKSESSNLKLDLTAKAMGVLVIGLDVHDVGGYLPGQPARPTEKGPNRLRFVRNLLEGMVVAMEPCCYFIDVLLHEGLADPKLSQFFVPEVIARFRNFGGVRIEDDVYITATGVEVTKVQRTVEEIENWMAGKDDPKYN